MKNLPPYLWQMMVRDMNDAVVNARPTTASREMFGAKLNAWFFVVQSLEPGADREALKDWLLGCSFRFAGTADAYAAFVAQKKSSKVAEFFSWPAEFFRSAIARSKAHS